LSTPLSSIEAGDFGDASAELVEAP
jgi:hypothetical protein